MKPLLFLVVLIYTINAMHSQSQLQTVNFEELGVSFTIPIGWSSQIDGDYMFLKHATMSGLIVVFESRSKSINKLITLANNGIVDEGVQLNSLNDFKAVTENRVEGHYKGVFMNTLVKAYAIGIINGLGSGVSMLAIAEPKDFNVAIKNEAIKLSNTIVFEEIKLSKQTKFWNDRLVGKRLNYFKTQTSTSFDGNVSGISDRETIDLFNDGSFYYHTKNQSLVNSASMRTGDKLSGDFRIVTLESKTYLQLFYNGDTLEFELSRSEKNYTLLNGRRYLLENLED
jgi:hypothetical protein